ncbi:MAG: hypothetical protein BWY31_04545 [Lentisphaerae bacterium ADurb.Bin242]|nr:MAG: hypothetical protein BWY31_04545 [Lentisphaerae bacterium ADurb.Bin242]
MFFPVESVKVKSPLEKEAGLLPQQHQRILESVIDRLQEPRPEFDAQPLPGQFHDVPDPDSVRIFEDLHIGAVPANANHFAFESFTPDKDIRDLILQYTGVKLDRQHVAVDPDNLAFLFGHILKPLLS